MPRARHAYAGHQTTAMAMTECCTLSPSAAAAVMARMVVGEAEMRAVRRISDGRPPPSTGYLPT